MIATNPFLSLTIRVQSSRFSKIQKFVPLIFFNCEPIFYFIRGLKSWVCQKVLPAIFERKRVSLSFRCLSKLSLVEIYIFKLKIAAAASSGDPGLSKNFHRRKKIYRKRADQNYYGRSHHFSHNALANIAHFMTEISKTKPFAFKFQQYNK